MPKLKAYRVDSGNEEGHCKIVFDTNNASARRAGATAMDCTFEEVESCRRAPEYDAYAPGPVPFTVLMADGWWQECLHCGVTVREDHCEEDEDGNELVFQPVDHGSQVFCCPACQGKYFARQRANEAARAALLELVETKFPGAQVTRVHVYGERLTRADKGHGIEASADFKFPGCTGIASYHFGEPHVYVHQEDVDTFKALYPAGNQEAAHG